MPLSDGKYKVNLEAFSGPLDLLLRLIEDRKMHISDISLGEITDDYMRYLEKIKEYSLESSADFVLTASILMLIKSKSLLPTLDLSREEEQSIEDLENRLKEYQRIKHLSQHVQKRFAKNIIFFREPNNKKEVIFSPDKSIKKNSLLFSIKNLLKNIPQEIVPPKALVDKIISLEEVIENLSERIKNSFSLTFGQFSGTAEKKVLSKEEKINAVVSFLAMLELVKQGMLIVKQEACFGEIKMENQRIETPDYN
ncbi:MAG: segregation/condensation protein A [Patescibacteria group bacterium]